MSRRVEPYDEENDEIAQEKKKIKARMAAEAIEEARKQALAPPAAATPHPGSDDLEQLMTCCICMDRFRVPKMLPCQHSFCAHCLEGLYDWIKRQIKCPECRTEHHCSNPENFPTNLTMVRFMEVHIEAMGGDPADAMAPPPSLQRCTVCGDNAELAKCSHCDRKVCTDCRDGHMEIMKRELGRLINQVKRGVSRLEESAGWIERNETQLAQNCTAIREEIQDVVRRYLKEIKDREDLLLNQVNTFLQAESKSTQHMQDNLDEEIKALNTAVDEAQKLLDPESNTSIDEVMSELSAFKEQFSKSVDFLKNFTPDAQEFTKGLKFLRGPSEPDLLHQCILAFGELHVSTQHFNRFVSNSERMATQLIERQFEATLADYNRQQQEESEQAAHQAARTVPQLPVPELDSGRTFQSEYMTRRLGESLTDYRDRRLESSPSRFTAAEVPTTRQDYSRESSAPASYLARVSRLTDTSSSGADTTTATGRSGGTSENVTTAGSNRRQKYKDGRSHTADLGLLRESVDEHGRRNSGDDLDVEVADALANRGRYASARRVESQDSTESVSGDGRRGGRYRGGAKTAELNDAFAVPDVAITPSRSLYQRETSTSESPLRTAATRGAPGAGSSACEQAINRRRRRFATQPSQEDTPVVASTPVSTASAYSARSPYSASSATGARSRETSPVRRARTPMLDESDDELARDREERMPFYSRYLANKAKSREVSPTTEYRANSAARDLGSASSALSRDSAYLNKGRTSTKIGSRGSEAGQLNWPRGVAAGSDNRVLVADSANHRVSIFEKNGTFIKSFGSYGSAPGEFDCLAGLAVAPDGRIVVADRYNHRISVHDATGRFMTVFGKEGHIEGQFQYPYGVCIGNGYIYVCDKDNARVQKFTLDGRFVSKFGGPGVRPNSLNNPHYITLSASGDRVIVADSGNNRIQVFDARDGTPVAIVGAEGTTEGCLQYPRGLAVDENDYLYVADAGNNRVQIFGNRDYRYVSSFGCWGNMLGEFKGIEGLAVARDGSILVADRDNHRIQVF